MLGPGSTLGPVCAVNKDGDALRTCWGRGTGLAHLDVTGRGLQTDPGMGVSKNTDIAMPPERSRGPRAGPDCAGVHHALGASAPRPRAEA